MARFNNTEFAEGLNCSFADFKKMFAGVIDKNDLEKAYKVATGNAVRKTKKSTVAKSSKSSD